MSHEEQHIHTASCSHGEHSHGKMPLVLFFVGLGSYLVALFTPVQSLSTILYLVAIVTAGYHIITEGFISTYKATKGNRKFTPNVHILMTLAVIGASIIGEYAEGALLIVIFAGAHFLEDYAEGRSKREITNLLNLNPTEARLINEDGAISLVAVSSLNIGDTLQVLNGDQVPTDGIILSGYSSIDESSINGESIPREKSVGDEVFGSTMNGNGSFTMKVTKDPSDTLFAKIVEMVNQSQSNLTKTATKIQRFEPRYVTLILILVPIFILLGPTIFKWSWDESFYRGMVFLTVSSPCALAASAVPATLSAISNMAKNGVLFKGGSYISNLAEVQAVAFDKTGTLTQGKPIVTDVYFVDESHKEEAINIIVAIEKTANHPLAQSILNHFNASEDLLLDVENVIGQGLHTDYNNAHYQIGAPTQFENSSEAIKAHLDQYSHEGKTVVYFAKDGVVMAVIAMMDLPQDNAINVIKYLQSQNIHTIMITGDSKVAGEAVGRMLGIDQVIGNVLPENKAHIVESLQVEYGVVAMLGDGVNDAPALVQSDIGIAMGEGTDIAIDVADAVLMQNNLNQLEYAHKTAKRLDKIVMQNVTFAMSVVTLLIILNILGAMNLPLGIVAHEGSTILVILNGLRLLKTTPR